jgi:excisionase family DNA binding protein
MKIIVTTKEELEELMSSSVRKGIEEYFLEQELKKQKAPHTTIQEASKQLKVSEQTIRNYVKRGMIKANKVGRRILIETTSIDKALSEVKSLKYKR